MRLSITEPDSLISESLKVNTMQVTVKDKHFTLILGPAGSGKTTLCKALGRWISKVQGIKVAYVNLDPGAEYLPYKPDIDVRNIVRLESVMKTYNLGPNGALVKSMDLLKENLEQLTKDITSLEAEYVIIDTPGQMELFLFRDIGPLLVRELKRIGFVTSLMVADLTLSSKASDIVSLKLLTLISQLRLGTDTIPVINKIDEKKSEGNIRIYEDPLVLRSKIMKEKGVSSEISEKILDILNEYNLASRIVKVSAIKETGLEELYDIMHEVYCTCGDLT